MKHKQAVGVIVQYQDRILMLQRNPNKKMAFAWCLPGGKSEGEETILATGFRELLEETGIIAGSAIVLKEKLLTPTGHDLRVIWCKMVTLPYVTLNEEHIGFGWFDLNHINIMEYEPLSSLILKYCKNG